MEQSKSQEKGALVFAGYEFTDFGQILMVLRQPTACRVPLFAQLLEEPTVPQKDVGCFAGYTVTFVDVRPRKQSREPAEK